MTASRDSNIDIRDPNARPLGGPGMGAIIVPLIIGGAIIIGAIMLWEAHTRNQAIIEIARTEIKVREELRLAYAELRNLHPEEALTRTAVAAQLMDERLHSRWQSDYRELKTARNLIEAEALLMLDCAANAAVSEKLFDQALGWMTHASGEFWQFGVLGRARTRYETGRYEEALADLDMLMDRNPNFGAAYYWRALAKQKLGDRRGAVRDETRARSLDSWPPLRDFMLASCEWNRDFLTKPER